MKKTGKRIISVMLAFLLIAIALCPQFAAADETKYTFSLAQEIKKNKESYTVAVSVEEPFENWVADTRYDNLVTDDTDEEALQALIEKLKKENPERVYFFYRASLLNSFGLGEDRVTFLSQTFLVATLTKEEIEKVSDCKYVEKIDVVNNYGDFVTHTYNSADALKILQFSVGSGEGTLGWKYDINSDGKINSSDALLALQSSVGSIKVIWNLCGNSVTVEK